MGATVSMVCALQLAPPSIVWRIVPLAPMIHPCLSSTKNTPVSCRGVPLVCFFHFWPAVNGLDDRPTGANRPSEVGITEIYAHERYFRPGLLR